MLTKEQKASIMKDYARSEADTGSPEVQIALISARISMLTEHAQRQPKDHDSRRGLLKLVGQRRSFLNYLMRIDHSRYQAVVQKLGIRK